MKSLPTTDELKLWSLAFESAETQDILRWTAAVYGDGLSLGTGFGVSGMVLLDMLARIKPDIDVFFLDTGLLFPETYDLRKRLEDHYQIHIRAVQPNLSLQAQAGHFGDCLWDQNPDLCCALRKIASLDEALRHSSAWMTAIRRDQSPTRRKSALFSYDERHQVAKIAPLVRWSEQECWAYVRKHHVPYNELHDKGYPSVGCWPCTRAVRPGEALRAGRWAGRAKTECGLHMVDGQLTRTPVPTIALTEAG